MKCICSNCGEFGPCVVEVGQDVPSDRCVMGPELYAAWKPYVDDSLRGRVGVLEQKALTSENNHSSSKFITSCHSKRLDGLEKREREARAGLDELKKLVKVRYDRAEAIAREARESVRKLERASDLQDTVEEMKERQELHMDLLMKDGNNINRLQDKLNCLDIRCEKSSGATVVEFDAVLTRIEELERSFETMEKDIAGAEKARNNLGHSMSYVNNQILSRLGVLEKKHDAPANHESSLRFVKVDGRYLLQQWDDATSRWMFVPKVEME